MAGRRLGKFEEESLGQLLPVSIECNCPSAEKRIPVKRVATGVEAVRRQLNGFLKSDIPILTVRCSTCRSKAVLTLNDIFEVE
jgi:hypothetical protein